MKDEHTIAQEFSKRADLYEKAKWVKDDAFLEDLVVFAKLRGDECALEIGIGSGAVAAKMRKHTGVLIGVDASKDMLQKAQRYLPRHHLLCYDIERLASLFLEETFDLVYCRAVLHHVDIPRTLAEMHSLIKPGGKLLIVETVAATREDEEFQLRFVESLHTGHTKFPTAERLCEMIEKAGRIYKLEEKPKASLFRRFLAATWRVFKRKTAKAGFEIQDYKTWTEQASLQNILASTAKSDQEKAEISTMFQEASEQTKSWWNMLFEGDDILFDKKWVMILATRC